MDNEQKWIFCPNCGSKNRPERRSCFNCEASLPRSKGQRPWYENQFWGPLTIAVVGAIIVLVGQLAATILPIYYGPSSLCDFSIKADPASGSVQIYNDSSTIVTQISASNIYWPNSIKEYKHPIDIKVVSRIPEGVTVIHEKTSHYLPINITLYIQVDGNKSLPGEYPITIQGMGEDGLKRNCTYILDIQRRGELEIIARTLDELYKEFQYVDIAKEIQQEKGTKGFRIYTKDGQSIWVPIQQEKGTKGFRAYPIDGQSIWVPFEGELTPSNVVNSAMNRINEIKRNQSLPTMAVRWSGAD
jgi:hypothetical protein